jgi:hypothetical protein
VLTTSKIGKSGLISFFYSIVYCSKLTIFVKYVPTQRRRQSCPLTRGENSHTSNAETNAAKDDLNHEQPHLQ